MDLLGKSWQKAQIVILAGTGGNGGGGICATRHFANREANVSLVITDPKKLSEVVAWQFHVYAATGGEIVQFDKILDCKPDIIIDALIGYSLSKAPYGKISELLMWGHNSETIILSLDIPSGINYSTGIAPGLYVKASQTMTLVLPKIGLENLSVGEITLADIGIPSECFSRAGIEYKNSFQESFRVLLSKK